MNATFVVDLRRAFRANSESPDGGLGVLFDGVLFQIFAMASMITLAAKKPIPYLKPSWTLPAAIAVAELLEAGVGMISKVPRL
ncbi:MAG: hypothetical protein ABIE42_09200 [Candidatus Eisenbacteria bacterium]